MCQAGALIPISDRANIYLSVYQFLPSAFMEINTATCFQHSFMSTEERIIEFSCIFHQQFGSITGWKIAEAAKS